jgi:5'(3')-deoxyribonucleotidase
VSERDRTFIFGVDLDGVVANHTHRFREIYAGLTGIDPESLPLERSWDFHEWGFGPDEYAHYHRIAVMEHDMFRTMPVIDGATDALWRLSDAGIWIRIITHRLYVHWGHEKAVADTAAWLDANRIPYRDLCFLGAKPQVEADAYIDDAPHNIEQLRAEGNTVIAFAQPYNRHLNDGLRAETWADAEEIITELAVARMGQVETQLPGIDPGADRLDRRRS